MVVAAGIVLDEIVVAIGGLAMILFCVTDAAVELM